MRINWSCYYRELIHHCAHSNLYVDINHFVFISPIRSQYIFVVASFWIRLYLVFIFLCSDKFIHLFPCILSFYSLRFTALLFFYFYIKCYDVFKFFLMYWYYLWLKISYKNLASFYELLFIYLNFNIPFITK